MFYLLCLVSLVLLVSLNLKYIFVNEELIMCFSLILFFTVFFNATRKLFLGFFYTEIKSMYLVYYFLFLLNIKLIKNVKILFLFLANKINYSFLSEFIYSLNRIFFINEQFKYENVFTY